MTEEQESELRSSMCEWNRKNDIRWAHNHAEEPCDTCGKMEQRGVTTSGSIGRIVMRCASCSEISQLITNAWHNGFASGHNAAVKRSRWQRLRDTGLYKEDRYSTARTYGGGYSWKPLEELLKAPIEPMDDTTPLPPKQSANASKPLTEKTEEGSAK